MRRAEIPEEEAARGMLQFAGYWWPVFRAVEMFFKYLSWLAIIGITRVAEKRAGGGVFAALDWLETGLVVILLMWALIGIVIRSSFDNSGRSQPKTLTGIAIILASTINVWLLTFSSGFDSVIDGLASKSQTYTCTLPFPPSKQP